MPDLRPLHYWAKASLFALPIAREVLLACGVIPVDRGSKDNQVCTLPFNMVLYRLMHTCVDRNSLPEPSKHLHKTAQSPYSPKGQVILFRV